MRHHRVVLSVRPDLVAALRRAEGCPTPGSADWLDHPPAGTHVLRRSLRLPEGPHLAAGNGALLGWDLHRRAGLRVAATGVAARGVSVVLEVRLGPVSVLAPCRVTDTYAGPDRFGFAYATLPGHPEDGAESFEFVRDPRGVRFEVRAVSRPAFWASRLMPSLARRAQARITDGYLRAAREIAELGS